MLLPYFQDEYLECGTDEAGRGCLAGPVTAAAVILPTKFSNSVLTDSKQLSEKKRELLKPIIETSAMTFGVCHVFEEEIDAINILNASITAMQRSITQLNPQPEFIIVDGNKFKPYNDVPMRQSLRAMGNI